MAFEFKLPDIGEGLHEGEIVKWHVKPGDDVKENQPLVDVLTDKATVEIPSPKSGKVLKLLAAPGEKVLVGQVLIVIGAAGEVVASPSKAAAPAASAHAAPQAAPSSAGAAPASGAGYEFKLPDIGEGLHEGEVVKWHVKEGDDVKENQPLVDVLTDKATVEIPSPKSGKVLKLLAAAGQKVLVGQGLILIAAAGDGGSAPSVSRAPSSHAPAPSGRAGDLRPAAHPPAALGGEALATPAVRKLAKELGVDLARVRPTGPQGRATEADVRQAAASAAPSAGAAAPAAPAAAPWVAHGPEERVPLRGIRRKTAEKMAQSTRIIPHVTHADEADVTALSALRQELKPQAEKNGVKLTFLPFIVKAVTLALKQFPELNASLDDAKQEIVHKRYYNIGIATATENGLFNPVVKDADKRDVWDIAKEIERVTSAARSNQAALADLQGGSFTITNIGGIGGTFATPIVVHPETGILGVMKIQKRPVVKDGQVVVRDMMNLCLSFDHRVLDGAEAAQFTNTLIKHLENPRTLLN